MLSYSFLLLLLSRSIPVWVFLLLGKDHDQVKNVEIYLLFFILKKDNFINLQLSLKV